MPQYMVQFTYARDTWAVLARQPFDRAEIVSRVADSLGGRLVSLHYTMGDFDGVAVVEAADDTAAMALAFRAICGGHLKTTKTTRLYTPQEIVTALRQAGEGRATAEAR